MRINWRNNQAGAAVEAKVVCVTTYKAGIYWPEKIAIREGRDENLPPRSPYQPALAYPVRLPSLAR